MALFTGPEFDSLRALLDALIDEVATLKTYEYQAVETFRREVIATVGLMHPLANGDSIRRIFGMNTALRQGYAHWLSGQSEITMSAFPADEAVFMRFPQRRALWKRRWKEAGGVIRKGRMVALRNDPIWGRLSFVGLPFPPFDEDCPLNVISVGTEETNKLGLDPGSPIPAPEVKFPTGILFFDMLPLS